HSFQARPVGRTARRFPRHGSHHVPFVLTEAPMRFARLPLLLATLFATVLTASIARAQVGGQKIPAAQTPSRTGQATVDDIIDRMTRAERAVLARLRTRHRRVRAALQKV